MSAECLGCGAPLAAPFLDLGMMPLANSYLRPEQVDEVEERFALAVAYCPGCHLVQLTRRLAPARLFTEYAYFSSYSESFVAHPRWLAESLMARFGLGSHSRVLEIASNDGYLLKNFVERGVPVLGVEPAQNVAEEAERRGIPTLKRFFGAQAVEEILDSFGRADVVIGNNVLGHVPEINDFLRAVKQCLKPSGAAVFEFPYIRDLVERVEFDTIYHEHVFYFSLAAVKRLAERAGLELFDVIPQPVHGGSLRVFMGMPGAWRLEPSVAATLAAEEQAGFTAAARYAAFERAVRKVRDDLVALLRALKAKDARVAAYGAPAKGNTLLNYCGIGRELIEFTVDRSPHKQGTLLPGSRIPVREPSALLAERPDYELLLAWNWAEEIIAQQHEHLERGGTFIIPVPGPRLVGGAGPGRAALTH